MRFTKMQGLGNDYVYVNGFTERVDDPAAMAQRVSDRHFGIGADGLILILPSDKADVRMRMFNADGSEAEMCGNGVRCVAKFAFDHELSKANPMRVETGRGVLSLSLELSEAKVSTVQVNMGTPILTLPEIPVNPEKVGGGPRDAEHLLVVPTALRSTTEMKVTFVSMGNPHAVIFTPDVAAVDLATLGPLVEHHAAFGTVAIVCRIRLAIL
jgi:diaminopimelate epimerase